MSSDVVIFVGSVKVPKLSVTVTIKRKLHEFAIDLASGELNSLATKVARLIRSVGAREIHVVAKEPHPELAQLICDKLPSKYNVFAHKNLESWKL